MRYAALLGLGLLLFSCGPDSGRGRHGPPGSGPGLDGYLLTDGAMSGVDQSIADDLGDLSFNPASDAAGAYADLGRTDSGVCAPPNLGATCAAPIAENAGCKAAEDCGPNGTGNGLDDNCNGIVDEGCSCTPGAVERCFLGPPGKHNIGACTDGQQTCQGAEFGTWGPCTGSISPQAETCDKLDNDCNGCADDGLCCGGVLACPASVADVNPYTDVKYNGASYFTAGAASWSWTIEGGPCDQLFATTTGTPPVQSFTLTGANTATPTFHPTLSGDYTVTMTVVGTDGKTYTCKWVQHVIGPGVRFELCWDHTGSGAQGGADLDLHVHRPGTTTVWFGASISKPNTDDCDYLDCNPDAYTCTPVPPFITCPLPAWGNAVSPLAECQGAPATAGGNSWSTVNAMCPNPRQDIDNIDTVGRPENVDIDNPKNGDSFRAMVHYYGQDGSTTTTKVEEHPIVNVYCGGKLKATYGQAPNPLGPCPGAACFNTGSGWASGLMWRVADVKAIVDASGNTTDCTVTALHPTATPTMGYDVTNNDTSY
jgi:hypothetical protein